MKLERANHMKTRKIHYNSKVPFTAVAFFYAALGSHAQQAGSPDFLNPLVVTGTRSERLLSEVPVRTEVIERDAMRKNQSRTVADAIEWENGVRVENDCQNCNFQQVRLLGLPGNFTQILADGRPSLSSLASVYGVEQLPIALVDRIESVTGGGSALYGPGAIAGVINVIPRMPTETGGYGKYEYSTMGGEPNHFLEGGLDFVSKDASRGMSFFTQSSNISPIDLDSDGFTEVAMREVWSGGMRAFLKPTSDSKLTFDYLYLNESRRGGDRLDLPVTQALIAEAIDSELHVGGLRWEQTVNDRFEYELNLSGTYTQRDTYYGSGMDPNAFGNSESPVVYLDLTGSYKISDDLRTTFGVQYQYENLKDTQPAYGRFTDQTVNNTGVFGQLEWDLAKQWSVIGGARVDSNSLVDHPVFSPRVAVKYNPLDELAIRGSYSSGFRAPQVFDEDLHVTQAGGVAQVIRNDAGLVEETSNSFALSAEWKSADPIRKQPFVLEGNLFFTRLNGTFDLLETDDVATPEQEFTRVNASDASVYGVELNLGYFITDELRLDLGLVEQRSRFDNPSGDFESRNFDRTPERYGVAGVTWDSAWCEVFVGAKYTGPMEVPHFAGFIANDVLEKSPSMVTWDVAVSRIFDVHGSEIEVSAGLKNIFNNFQDDLDQGPDRDSAYVYGPRFPRQFQIAVKYNF